MFLVVSMRRLYRATTPPQGEDKPSPLLWTSLARRFAGRGGASFEIHHCNAAGGLDIHAVNAARAALERQIGNAAYAAPASQSSNLQGLRYAQTECKEAAPASQSAVVNGLPWWSPCRGAASSLLA